jgi:hypothetical protein
LPTSISYDSILVYNRCLLIYIGRRV